MIRAVCVFAGLMLAQPVVAQQADLQSFADTIQSMAERCGGARIAGQPVDRFGLEETFRDENSVTLRDGATGVQLIIDTPVEDDKPVRCVVQASPGFLPQEIAEDQISGFAAAARERLTGYLFNTFDAGFAPVVRRCLGRDLPTAAMEAPKTAARISADGGRVLYAYVGVQAQITSMTVISLGPLGNCRAGQ